MTRTDLVQGAPGPVSAMPELSRLLDAFFAGRNERTLAAYRADLEAFPASSLSIAWLSNTSAFDRDANPPRQVINLFFINNQTGNKFEPITVSDTKTMMVLSPEELQPYTGYYYSTEAQTGFTVELKDHQLFLSRPPSTSFSIHPTKKDSFETGGTPFDGASGTITFVPDKGDDKGNDKGAPKKMLISIDRALNVSFIRSNP